jgi:hypothetical protein
MKDRPERRTYRRSPGRQYGYEYDPLRTQNTGGQNQRLDTSSLNGQRPATEDSTTRTTGRISGPLAPRPDPRRTRQLIRQSIIASKSRSALLEAPQAPDTDMLGESPFPGRQQDTDEDRTLFRNRHPQSPRSGRLPASNEPRFTDLDPDEDVDEQWGDEPGDIDPDQGYDYDEEEEPLESRFGYGGAPQRRSPASRSLGPRPARSSYLPAPADPVDRVRRTAPPVYDDDLYEEYDLDDEPQVERRKKKKGGLTRRKLLLGIGAVAVGGGAIAAYEYGPKLPQELSNVGSNIEHQIQDAFNRGVAAGAEAARKEIISSLESLEGVSLDAAIGAARLTRMAYDVFVSPIVTFASTVVGDVLSVALKTVNTARGWLKYYGQGNATLDAFAVVLQSWVNNAAKMPKQIQSITDSDLDGATSYLNGLKQKIQQEQAKLNNGQHTTPTPTPTKTKPHS